MAHTIEGAGGPMKECILSDQEIWDAELGVLGTGRMGARLAAMFAKAGRKVVLGSRDPERAAAIVRELGIPNLRAGT